MSQDGGAVGGEASEQAFRWGAIALFSGEVACLLYAVDRARAALTNGPFDPAVVISTARIEYFWRLGMCAFVGAACAILLGFLPARWMAGRLGVATWALPVVIASCVTLSIIWP